MEEKIATSVSAVLCTESTSGTVTNNTTQSLQTGLRPLDCSLTALEVLFIYADTFLCVHDILAGCSQS